MRGKAEESHYTRAIARITPAHAGKRDYILTQACFSGDHPRTCGEKLSEDYAKLIERGSPPHMRGKEKVIIFVLNISGITPAHAGKSFSFQLFPQTYLDHPRTCGEK